MKNVYNYHIREKKPNMHFKADGGSNPPLFKCVVMWTALRAAEIKEIL